MNRVPDQQLFQQMLFAKIVPNCRKLGLLDAGDGWLRDRFTELGVIEFEHMADTGEEYEMFALAEGDGRLRLTRPRRPRSASPAGRSRRQSGQGPQGARVEYRWRRWLRLRFGDHRHGHAVRRRGRLDLDGAAELARWLVEQGNDALVLTGTTG